MVKWSIPAKEDLKHILSQKKSDEIFYILMGIFALFVILRLNN